MKRKKRVSVGVVLMGFFLIFVMLGGVAALVAHQLFLVDKHMTPTADKFTGFLHVLLNLGIRAGDTMLERLGASPVEYAVIGLMLTGILMFIISGFTKNHIVYLISILMTGTSVFIPRIAAFRADLFYMRKGMLEQFARSSGNIAELKTYNAVRLILDGLILAALVFLLVIWILSFVKDAKVKKGTGNPDKSLVIGFIPGLILILVYLGFLGYELYAMLKPVKGLDFYLSVRNHSNPWWDFSESRIFTPVALGLRYLFLSFQFGLLILFTGLWLNRPYKKLSAEEKAAAEILAKAAEEQKAAQAPYGQPYGFQYGQQVNPQYGQQTNPQYGQQANPQYGQQYGQQTYPQYGQQTYPQYGQQYGAPYEQQSAQAPFPVPIPVPVQEEPEKVAEEVREEIREEDETVAPAFGQAATFDEDTFGTDYRHFGEAKEEAAEAFGAVKEEAAGAFGEAKEEAAEAFGAEKEEAAETFGAVKEEAAETFGAVKEEAAEKFEEVRKERPAFKFCPSCGFKLPGAGKFCPSCGYKLHD